MTWLIVYCGASWLFGLVCFRQCIAAEELAREAGISLRLAKFIDAMTVLVAPILMLIVPILVCREAARSWKLWRFSRSYTEPEFTPVNSLTLEESVQDWFAKGTSAMFPFNFRLVTDCIFRSEPVQLVSRYLLSEDQKTIAELTVGTADCEDEDSHFFWTLLSVNDDGTFFESCTAAEDTYDELPTLDDQVVFTLTGEVELEELFQRHDQAVEAVGSPLLAWSPDEVLEVSRYGYRKAAAWKFRIGMIKAEPPAAELPPSVAASCDPVEVECLQTV